jgi:hypothetical protein
VNEVNLEEANEGVISERMIAWRQRCRQRRGAWRRWLLGGRGSGWRRGLGGNMREEARVFYVVFFILITLSDL